MRPETVSPGAAGYSHIQNHSIKRFSIIPNWLPCSGLRYWSPNVCDQPNKPARASLSLSNYIHTYTHLCTLARVRQFFFSFWISHQTAISLFVCMCLVPCSTTDPLVSQNINSSSAIIFVPLARGVRVSMPMPTVGIGPLSLLPRGAFKKIKNKYSGEMVGVSLLLRKRCKKKHATHSHHHSRPTPSYITKTSRVYMCASILLSKSPRFFSAKKILKATRIMKTHG